MELRGSKTEKNLYKTFAGESRARTKYSLYAEQAKCEGYVWISQIFEETAENEKAHARLAFKTFLELIGTTEENLLDAAKGEREETAKTYKEFEQTAKEEGFDDIAKFYKELREIEEDHCKRYAILYEKLKNDKLFMSSKEKMWRCLNCGYIYEGCEAPEICPACKYPQSFFKPYCKDEAY